MQRNVTPRPLRERFWAYVEKTDGCWPWTGPHTPAGYGWLTLGRRGWGQMYAHHLSWLLHFPGPFWEGWQVNHQCDNPGCVRPDHLWLGTQAHNMANARAKDRVYHLWVLHPRGDYPPSNPSQRRDPVTGRFSRT